MRIIVKDKKVRVNLSKQYRDLRVIINDCIKLLKSSNKKDLSIQKIISEESDSEEDHSESSDGEETLPKMAPKLDLGTALKLVDKFNGEAEKLSSFFETLDLLKDYNDGVPEIEILKFVKTRLTGPAHGVINTAVTMAEAKRLLKIKFSVKFSPQAIESEMATIKQNKKTLTDYGKEIGELAAKLAAAHVSNGTFADEAAAEAIVQPIAIRNFMQGLKDSRTQFFLKARNPGTLTRAISDALEVHTNEEETAMWMHAGPSGFYRGNYRGRSSNFRTRRGSRARGFGYGRGRGRGFHQNQQPPGNRQQPNNNNNYPQQNRGNNNRGRHGHANVAVQEPQQRPNQQQEEDVANIIELFRE